MSNSDVPQGPGSGGEPTGQEYGSPPSPGAPGGYQAMPGDSNPGGAALPTNAARPSSITMAVRLMYVGAALSVVGVLVAIVMKSQIHDRVRQALKDAGKSADTSQVHSIMVVTLGGFVIVGLIGVALWLFMAWANGKGKSWARIVATILGVLNVLSFLGSFVQHSTTPLGVVVGLINVLLAIVILVLLWRKESSDYYRAMSAKPA